MTCLYSAAEISPSLLRSYRSNAFLAASMSATGPAPFVSSPVVPEVGAQISRPRDHSEYEKVMSLHSHHLEGGGGYHPCFDQKRDHFAPYAREANLHPPAHRATVVDNGPADLGSAVPQTPRHTPPA